MQKRRKLAAFSRRAYFRLFLNWLLDLSSPDPILDSFNFQDTEYVEELKEAFKVFDKDQNGYISTVEFVKYGNEGSIVLLQACLDQVKFRSEDFQSNPNLLSPIFRYFLGRPNFATVFCED